MFERKAEGVDSDVGGVAEVDKTGAGVCASGQVKGMRLFHGHICETRVDGVVRLQGPPLGDRRDDVAEDLQVMRPLGVKPDIDVAGPPPGCVVAVDVVTAPPAASTRPASGFRGDRTGRPIPRRRLPP